MRTREDAKQRPCAPSPRSVALGFSAPYPHQATSKTRYLFLLQAPPLERQLNLGCALLVLPALPAETRLQDLFCGCSLEVACATFRIPTGHSHLHPLDPLCLAGRDDCPCLTTTTRTRRAADAMYVFRCTTFRWEVVLYDSAYPWQVKSASRNARAKQNRCQPSRFGCFGDRGECLQRGDTGDQRKRTVKSEN